MTLAIMQVVIYDVDLITLSCWHATVDILLAECLLLILVDNSFLARSIIILKLMWSSLLCQCCNVICALSKFLKDTLQSMHSLFLYDFSKSSLLRSQSSQKCRITALDVKWHQEIQNLLLFWLLQSLLLHFTLELNQ